MRVQNEGAEGGRKRHKGWGDGVQRDWERGFWVFWTPLRPFRGRPAHEQWRGLGGLWTQHTSAAPWAQTKVRFTQSQVYPLPLPPSPTMHIKAPLCMVPEVLAGSSSQGAPCPCSGVLAHQLSAVVLQKRPAPAPAPQLYAFVHSGGSCLSQFIFF